MTPEQEKILLKVKALFRLAENNPSEEESASALSKARALLTQYGLSMSAIHVADEKEADPFEADLVGVCVGKAKISTWKKDLAWAIRGYFDVKHCMSRNAGDGAEIIFYGVAVNATAASAAYTSVIVQIDKLADRYPVNEEDWLGSGRSWKFANLRAFSRAAKSEYRSGVVQGLRDRLSDVKRTEKLLHGECNVTALAIRYEEIADRCLARKGIHLRMTHSGRSATGTGSTNHFSRGQQDSRHVHLTKQIGGR